MKKIAGVLLIAALTTAPPAHADEQSFIDAASKLGYTQSVLRNGYAVCAISAEPGISNDLLARGLKALLDRAGEGKTPEQAQEFVNLAVANLCPSLVDR